MKNTFKLIGIIAMVALIGFSMVSCSDDEAGGGGAKWDGVWKGSYDDTDDDMNVIKSQPVTITIKGDDITIEMEGAKDTGKKGATEEKSYGFSCDITLDGVDGDAGSLTINDDGDKLTALLSKGNVKIALVGSGMAAYIYNFKK